jgi:hypothetical protein
MELIKRKNLCRVETFSEFISTLVSKLVIR